MKKILLIIALVLCIFQLIVMAAAITIGLPATDRPNALSTDNTCVNKLAVASETGTITSIEVWANEDLTNVRVATFFLVSGNNLTARDSEAIAGTITAGSKVTKAVTLDVVAGDYIGIYYLGMMDFTSSGYSGIWYLAGDQTSCTDTTFSLASAAGMSLYGTGTTAEEDDAIFFGINF